MPAFPEHVVVEGDRLVNLYSERSQGELLSDRCPYLDRLRQAVPAYFRASLGAESGFWFPTRTAVFPPPPHGWLTSMLDILEHTMQSYMDAYGSRHLQARWMFQMLRAFLRHEPGAGETFDSALAERFRGRPPVPPSLDQLPCTPHSTLKRAAMARGQALILGDDDLVSLALPGAVVLELDPLLLTFLRDRQVDVREQDLFTGLPPELEGQFDVVLTDPPYRGEGFSAFLAAARSALKPDGRLLLSTNLDMIDPPRSLTEAGFVVLEEHRDFNRYPYPQDFADSCVLEAARYDMPPELAELLFRPPFFYSDLYVLQPAG